MNRNVLLVALLGAAAFLATYLILDRLDDFHIASPEDAPRIPEGRPEAASGSLAGRDKKTETRASGNETDKPGRAPADAPAGSGSILAAVMDADGAAVRDFGLDLRPFHGRVANHTEGILEIEDIPAGTYTLDVWAQGLIRQSRVGVKVTPGMKTRLEFRLKEGFRPAGIVIDEKTRHPVAGVKILFQGGGRAVTGQDGRFEATYDLAPGCLNEITVSHPDYDNFTYHRLSIPDNQNILLAMTRGDSIIRGRILNRSGRALPRYYRLRLWMERGLNIPPEVRKERMFKPSEQFEFKGVHRGLYQLMLEFPDTNLAARHRTLKLGFKDLKDIELEISGGVRLQGRLVSRAKRSLVTKLQLFNSVGLVAATQHTTEEGEFSFEGVEPGTWRIRAWRGSPIIDFAPIEIGASNVHCELDVDRQRTQVRALKK